MWLFTPKGFISVVQHRSDPQTLIRARSKEHLETLFPKLANSIIETAMADYPFRLPVSKNRFKEFAQELIETLDYDNFKSAIKEETYHDACLRVWSDMRRYQTEVSE